MSSRIKLYTDTPTSGDTDGTLVSSGTDASPVDSGAITVPAASFENGSWVKLALRCDAGYETRLDSGIHAKVTLVDGAHLDKWQLAPDDSGSPDTLNATDWDVPETELDFTVQIDDTNTIFWARARVEHTEDAANDTSVTFRVEAVIGVA